MRSIKYRTKVLKDGHIPLPKRLKLNTGDQLEVIVYKEKSKKDKYPALTADDPIWGAIGIAKGDGGAVGREHDKYLYRKND